MECCMYEKAVLMALLHDRSLDVAMPHHLLELRHGDA